MAAGSGADAATAHCRAVPGRAPGAGPRYIAVKPSPGRATLAHPAPRGTAKAIPAARSVTRPPWKAGDDAAGPPRPASTPARNHAATPATTITATPPSTHLRAANVSRPAAGSAEWYTAVHDRRAGSRQDACRPAPPLLSAGKPGPGGRPDPVTGTAGVLRPPNSA